MRGELFQTRRSHRSFSVNHHGPLRANVNKVIEAGGGKQVVPDSALIRTEPTMARPR